jgi:hypothetical protein
MILYRTLATFGMMLAIIGGGLLLRPPAAATPRSTSDTVGGELHEVGLAPGDRTSTLVTIDPETGRVRRTVRLAYAVNAIGYHAERGLLYGVASRHRGHPIGDGGHLVAITPAGETRDLGPVRGGAARGGQDKIIDAYAGTVVDGRLHLLLDDALVVVDVDGNRVARRLRLSDDPDDPDLGDWDARPGDGALYGVSTHGARPTRLVRVDPRTGEVSEIPVRGLPDRGFFGAVAFGGAGHLYATDNNGGTAYRISLGSRTATALRGGPALRSSDAAMGRAHPHPPTTPPSPEPPPPPEPTPTRAPAPAAPTVRESARPPAPPKPTPPARPTPSPTPSRTAAPVAVVEPPRRREAAAVAEEDDRTVTVRMGMVLLVLGIGGSAAARFRRRG